MKRLLIGFLVAFLSFAVIACGDSADENGGDTGNETSENPEDGRMPFAEEQKKFIGHWKMAGFENSVITINSNFRFRMKFDSTKDDPPALGTLVFSEVEEPMLKKTYRKVQIQYDEGQPNFVTGSAYTYKLSEDFNTMSMGGPDHTRIDSEDDTSF